MTQNIVLQSSLATRPIPWHIAEPYRGCNGKLMNYSIWDDDGNLICECHGEEEGKLEAKHIVATVNAVFGLQGDPDEP